MLDTNNLGPEQQLEAFLSAQPIEIPRDLTLDGRSHRFGDGKKGREPHWYIGSKTNEGISFTVGSHKIPNFKVSFQSKSSAHSEIRWTKGMSLDEKWNLCSQFSASRYLQRKKIQELFGARINSFGDLVIPMYSLPEKTLVGLQTIASDGTKMFVKGSKKKGAYFELENQARDSPIYVAEGFATAASIAMATGSRVICAFDCGNLPLVVKSLAELCPDAKIVVAGDDDRFSNINSGRAAAEAVSTLASAIFPVFSSDEGNPTDWNDLHIKEGIEEVKKQITAQLGGILLSKDSISKIRNKGPEKAEMVKIMAGKDLEDSIEVPKDEVLPALLRGHVGILCSPGGYGKSGVSQLIANQIASGGAKDFLGFGPVVGGSAVILTLEDPVEIYSARQKQIIKDCTQEERRLIRDNFYLIKGLCRQGAVESEEIVEIIKTDFETNKRDISALRLLIIDHLSFWSNLDLNESKSAAILMKEFNRIGARLNCAVLILHHSNRSSMIKGKDRQSGSSAIGGSYKFHSLSRWVAMIEDPEINSKRARDESEKILIVDKANHGKKISLRLRHREERCGLLYRYEFESKCIGKEIEIQPPNLNDIITLEEIETFNMGEASPKLISLEENTHHIMRWLTRNPAFETVSTKRRASLTKTVNGEDIDKDRDEISIYKDVWIKGDTLIIQGPVCGQEDMKLYALLVRELVETHKSGQYGLNLSISTSKILRLLNLPESGAAKSQIKRQLSRLTRMSLRLKSLKGRSWMGPLITEVLSEGDGRTATLIISFSHFMISFYKAHDYTLLDRRAFWALSGDSATLFAFYASQDFKTQNLPVSQVQKILAMPEIITRKAAMRRIKAAYQKLIDVGIFDKSLTTVKKDVIHTERAH